MVQALLVKLYRCLWLNTKQGTNLIQLKLVKWSPFELNVQFRVTIQLFSTKLNVYTF